MKQPHIFRQFDTAMSDLKAEVISMASLARHNLERAIHALLERDIDLACAVIADALDVDELQRQIDLAGMSILVRFQPVASDLRLIITSMKMAHNLERISDHAVSIAKRAKKIGEAAPLDEASLAEPLYSIADKLLRDAVTAYADANAQLGESLKPQDKELDRLHKQMIATLTGRLENSGGRAEHLLHLIFVARSIERIGDLAVNIGEDAVFLGDARSIRHDHRKSIAVPPATNPPES